MILLKVTWNDAWAKAGSHSVDELVCAPAVTETIGWLIKENRSGILLATELWPAEPESVGYPTFIPKKMIVSRVTIEEAPSTPSSV